MTPAAQTCRTATFHADRQAIARADRFLPARARRRKLQMKSNKSIGGRPHTGVGSFLLTRFDQSKYRREMFLFCQPRAHPACRRNHSNLFCCSKHQAAFAGPDGIYCAAVPKKPPTVRILSKLVQTATGLFFRRPQMQGRLKELAEKSPSLPEALAASWPVEQWRDVTVVIAVSGGPDSVALLRAMHSLKTKAGGPGELIVAHFNHHLRPEADEDQEFVSDLAAGSTSAQFPLDRSIRLNQSMSLDWQNSAAMDWKPQHVRLAMNFFSGRLNGVGPIRGYRSHRGRSS